MKTKLIASWKLVSKNHNELYIITTVDGDTIWVPKSQFDTNAETITFELQPKGSKYIDKNGVEGITTVDRNEFKGCGKQIVKKYSNVELFQELHKIGITPMVSLS